MRLEGPTSRDGCDTQHGEERQDTPNARAVNAECVWFVPVVAANPAFLLAVVVVKLTTVDKGCQDGTETGWPVCVSCVGTWGLLAHR